MWETPHCEKVGQYFSNTLPNVVPIVNPTIYLAIVCPVVLVNVGTLLHTCIIVSYFDQQLGQDFPNKWATVVGQLKGHIFAYVLVNIRNNYARVK